VNHYKERAVKEEIRNFLDYLRQRRGYSERTIESYWNDLSQAASFFVRQRGAGFKWANLTPQDLQDYVSHLRGRGYSVSSISRKISSFRSFLHYLYREGVIAQDYGELLAGAKAPKRPPKFLPEEDLARLLEAPSAQSDPRALRDKAILEVLSSTGMKILELVSLNLEDVDLASGAIRIMSRKGKERIVSLSEQAREALKAYVEQGRIHFLKPNSPADALFLNAKGQRLSRQGVWVIVKQYAKALGISVSPKVFRHSLIHKKLKEKAKPEDLKKLLGYSGHLDKTLYSEE